MFFIVTYNSSGRPNRSLPKFLFSTACPSPVRGKAARRRHFNRMLFRQNKAYPELQSRALPNGRSIFIFAVSRY